jgi:magnesium-transporting ATPase (P-type)
MPAGEFAVDPDALYKLLDKDAGRSAFAGLGGDVEGLATLLKSDAETGLADNEALGKARVAAFGANCLPPPDEVTFMELVKNALSDQMMLLLVASAVVSLILGLTVADPHTGKVDYESGWIEGTAILVSVAIVTLVTSVNDYQKEQKFKELSEAVPPAKVKVDRAGKTVEVTEDQLVVGDVMHLVMGMICPADAVFIQGQGIKMDESAATGENDELEKDRSADPIFRSGTNVLEGEATALVIGVGEQSLAGRIAMAVRSEKSDTPLQEKLDDLANMIGYLGMVAAVLMFVVLSIKELLKVYYWKSSPLVIKKFLDMITTSVTIVVVAVPEGLPLSVTIALAYSMKQMMHENNLVRHLAACETMGGATSICTDKTGTLTLNEMSVMRGYVAGRKFVFNGDRVYDRDIVKTQIEPHTGAKLQDLLQEAIAINTSANKITDNKGVTKYVGNKTEQALLLFVEKLGGNPATIRQRIEKSNKRAYPFTSSKKSMTTVVRVGGTTMRSFVKGASEIVLASCQTWHNGSEVETMSEYKRGEIAETINEFAKNRLRTLVIAYGDEHNKPKFDEREGAWPPLTFLGLVGIEDPIRPEVEGAVGRCKAAGVAVRMVTGDNKATAIAIAKKAGIYGDVYWGTAQGEHGLAMEGVAFRELAKSPARLNMILPRLQVLARASPLDKQILVTALMDRGEVVAVTGDGTNDAPALKNANVGFAMNTGTDVAKKASDVVILDDNFKSIVTAMKWGRNVNDNICKFIQFQTTVNVAAVFIAFVGAVTSGSGESPLKPVQLLWLNLIMDTMAALALATERPTDSLLDRPPRSRDAPLITRRMWLNIIGQSLYQIGIQLWLLNRGHKWFRVKHMSETHLTVIFNVFVLMQVANEFNARMLGGGIWPFRGLHRAPLFMAIIVITIVVQYAGVTFFGSFMKCIPLSRRHWQQCLLLSIVPLPLGVFLRLFNVTEPVTPIWTEIEHDPDAEPEGPMSPAHRRLTGIARFRQAVRKVQAQLKVAGALAEAVADRG